MPNNNPAKDNSSIKDQLPLSADLQRAIAKGDVDKVASLIQDVNARWNWVDCTQQARKLCGG